MPLYANLCPECGAVNEHFCHVPADRGCATPLCSCGSTMAPVLSVGAGLTWFRENAGRWITNLGDRPVFIRSHEEHKAEMKKAGVEWATERMVKGTGGWI